MEERGKIKEVIIRYENGEYVYEEPEGFIIDIVMEDDGDKYHTAEHILGDKLMLSSLVDNMQRQDYYIKEEK